MNPSILGKAIELDAARAHFVTTSLAAWLFLRYRSDKNVGKKKSEQRKKRPKEPLTKRQGREGNLREGDAR
jgi:hypothetical protein